MNSIPVGTKIEQPAAEATRIGSAYLPGPELVEVLFEQVEYLVRHGSECRLGCGDCLRVARMKSCLLQPFSSRARLS